MTFSLLHILLSNINIRTKRRGKMVGGSTDMQINDNINYLLNQQHRVLEKRLNCI